MTSRDANDKKNAIQPRPKNPRRGRPSTYRPEVAALYCELVGSGASDTAAAKEAGVPRSTVKAWMQERADFTEAVEAAQVERLHALEDLSLDAIADMDRMSKSPDYSPAQVQAVKYKYDMCVKLLTAYRQQEAARQEAGRDGAPGGDMEAKRKETHELMMEYRIPPLTKEEHIELSLRSAESAARVLAQLLDKSLLVDDTEYRACRTVDDFITFLAKAAVDIITERGRLFWHSPEGGISQPIRANEGEFPGYIRQGCMRLKPGED